MASEVGDARALPLHDASVDAWLDDPPRRAALLRAIERVEAEPSLLGASPHLLAVGVKR